MVWKRNDTLLSARGNPGFRITSSPGGAYCLNIRQVRHGDAGKYTCIAENDRGVALCSAFLSIDEGKEKYGVMQCPSRMQARSHGGIWGWCPQIFCARPNFVVAALKIWWKQKSCPPKMYFTPNKLTTWLRAWQNVQICWNQQVFDWTLSMERNPFSAQNHTLRSYRVYISPTQQASSALIQIVFDWMFFFATGKETECFTLPREKHLQLVLSKLYNVKPVRNFLDNVNFRMWSQCEIVFVATVL